MPVAQGSPAPYAPPATVLNIVERYRSRGLPTPINHEVLARASVPDSLIKRTLQAFRILDLISENGTPTPIFEAIRLAPEAEYQATLAKWLEATYSDVLQFVDPATASETNLADAFRQYQPQGQRSRMITLFTGLFRAAGIGPEKASGAPRKVVASGASPRARPASAPRSHLPPARHRQRDQGALLAPPGLHPALAGVLSSLPNPQLGWVQTDRDRFLTAFTAVLDFAIPVVANIAPPAEEAVDDIA